MNFHEYHSVHDVIEAQKQVGGSVFSFIFADEKDIGFFGSANYPIRPSIDLGARGIKEGFTGEHDWQGYYPTTQNPHVINPEKGFIVTANNKVGTENASFETYYATTHRSNMITRLLKSEIEEKGKLTPAEIRSIQYETYDTLTAHKHQQMLRLLIAHKEDYGDYVKTYEFLSNPDIFSNPKKIFNQETESYYSTIFNVWEYFWADQFLQQVFENDQMRRQLTVFYGYDTFLLNTVDKLVSGDGSYLNEYCQKDGLRKSPKACVRNLATAFDKAWVYLKDNFGEDYTQWQWKKAHKTEYDHMPFSKTPLKWFFHRTCLLYTSPSPRDQA